MRSIDVFISHKLEDIDKARQLKARIKSWNLSCYIDADDECLKVTKDPRELSIRIRTHLRRCRCLIYAFSSQSAQSKWMPWELGFYDGRWGQNQIGLYDLDGSATKDGPEEPDHDLPRLTIQEYLKMYRLVSADELESFIRESTSTRALADRADVDVDRFTTLLEGALRNPMAFSIGCAQYGLSLQRSFLTMGGLPDNPAFEQLLNWLHSARAAAEQKEMPKSHQESSEQIAGTVGAASGDALESSGTGKRFGV